MRRVVIGILLAVLAYFAVTTLLFVVWMGRDQRPHADAIVVLGAAQYNGRPSAIYEVRLQHAVDLYSSGVARLVVFTGGKEPGDRFTEGGSGAHWAELHGVPASATVIEDQSRTTYQNLSGTKRLLQSRVRDRPMHIVVVSDPYHMYRAITQARGLGFKAYASPTRTSPVSASRVKLTEAVLREDIALGGYLLTRGHT